MDQVTLSVCCTTYNDEKYVRQALDSFLMQKTDFPFEIIVHDDASTDRTQEILREYQSCYPDQIRLILQTENQYQQGRSTSRIMNPYVRGTYVALCEGDDYWTDENKLQLQVDYLKAHPDCALAAHQAIRIRENGDYVSPYSNDSHGEDYDMDFADVIGDLSRFPWASMVFRSTMFRDNADFLETNPHFDYVYKLLLAGTGRVHVLAQPMSAYRMAATGSWTEQMQRDDRKYIAHMEKAIATYKALDAHFEGRFHEALEKMILDRTAEVYEVSGDLKALRRKEMRPYYRKLSRSSRLSLYLRSYAPGIYRRLKGKA